MCALPVELLSRKLSIFAIFVALLLLHSVAGDSGVFLVFIGFAALFAFVRSTTCHGLQMSK